jgi:hypothetical protein
MSYGVVMAVTPNRGEERDRDPEDERDRERGPVGIDHPTVVPADRTVERAGDRSEPSPAGTHT